MLFSALLGLIIRNHRTIYLKYLSILPLLHQGADRSLGVGGGWWKRKCQETENREVLLHASSLCDHFRSGRVSGHI